MELHSASQRTRSKPSTPAHARTYARMHSIPGGCVQCSCPMCRPSNAAKFPSTFQALSLSLSFSLSLSPFLLSLSLSLGRKRPRGTQTDRQTQTDRHVDRIGSIVLEFTVCRSFLARGFCCAGCHWWQWRGRQPRGRRALTIR